MRLPIAEYGRKDLLLSTIVCAVLTAAPVLLAGGNAWIASIAIVPFVVWLILVNFFRDPERTIPRGADWILSPADGVVSDLEEVDEPEFLGGRAIRMGIFLSPLNVHVNRAPMDCEVVQVDYRRGAMHKAYDPRARTENEAAAIRLAVRDGQVRMIVRQVTGALARRIVCPVQPGTRLRAGDRYGMIKLGSRTEVWLRADQPVTWRVKIGDVVRGGLTVLGDLGASADPGTVTDAA